MDGWMDACAVAVVVVVVVITVECQNEETVDGFISSAAAVDLLPTTDPRAASSQSRWPS
jgi:hypothetical protein